MAVFFPPFMHCIMIIAQTFGNDMLMVTVYLNFDFSQIAHKLSFFHFCFFSLLDSFSRGFVVKWNDQLNVDQKLATTSQFPQPSNTTRCKIALNLLFTHGKKFCLFIRVSVLLYIPSLPLLLLCLPPTHPTMCLLVSISVCYFFKSNLTVKIPYFVRLFSITMK